MSHQTARPGPPVWRLYAACGRVDKEADELGDA